MRDGCPFCDYDGPSEVVGGGDPVFVIEPIGPVTEGHVLVIPRLHVPSFADATTPEMWEAVTETFRFAATWATAMALDEHVNLITSRGRWATQTVGHLHVHLVPRRSGDGLKLPWSAPS